MASSASARLAGTRLANLESPVPERGCGPGRSCSLVGVASSVVVRVSQRHLVKATPPCLAPEVRKYGWGSSSLSAAHTGPSHVLWAPHLALCKRWKVLEPPFPHPALYQIQYLFVGHQAELRCRAGLFRGQSLLPTTPDHAPHREEQRQLTAPLSAAKSPEAAAGHCHLWVPLCLPSGQSG